MASSKIKFQFRYSYERDLIDTQAKISIAGSGAPTLTQAKGIASITHNSAGNYTIVMQERTYLLMDVKASFISGASAPAAPIINVVSEQVNNASPSLIIQCRDLSGAAADPASGEVMLLHIQCRSAST